MHEYPTFSRKMSNSSNKPKELLFHPNSVHERPQRNLRTHLDLVSVGRNEGSESLKEDYNDSEIGSGSGR